MGGTTTRCSWQRTSSQIEAQTSLTPSAPLPQDRSERSPSPAAPAKNTGGAAAGRRWTDPLEKSEIQTMTVMQDDPLSLPGKYAQEQTPVAAVFNDFLTFSRQCLGGAQSSAV